MTNQERAQKIVWHDRFWAKVKKTETCWIWTAALNGDGYGSFCIDGVQRGTHRIAFEIVNGPIDKGFELDHLCRNPPCCRPSHLEPVSHKVNMLRGNNVSAINAKKTLKRFKDITGCRMDYDNAVKEALKIIVSEAVRDGRERHKKSWFQDGFAAAREKAAGIADNASNTVGEHKRIAERIRAMEADK